MKLVSVLLLISLFSCTAAEKTKKPDHKEFKKVKEIES